VHAKFLNSDISCSARSATTTTTTNYSYECAVSKASMAGYINCKLHNFNLML